MDDGKVIWSKWQSLLTEFQPLFTRGGWVRFVQWVTGMALCDEEHTITQILTTLGLESRWRVSEAFAEYGAWDREAVERRLFQAIEASAPACWGGYGVVAVDDTKGHRRAPGVWGTSLLHQTSGRDRNRAKAVLAHNWVVLGAGARPAVDLPPRRRPAVYPPQCLAGRRDVLDEKPIGGGDASPGRPRRQSPAFGRAGWGFCPCQRAAALPESSSGRAADRLRHPAAPRRSFVQTAGDQTEESVLRGASTAVGPTPCQPEGPRAVERAVAAGPSLHLWPHAQFPRPTGLGPMGGHRQGPSGACLCLRGGRLPQTVVPDLQREKPLCFAGRGGRGGAVPPRGRLPRPKTASGHGGVPRVDQRADLANVPGATGCPGVVGVMELHLNTVWGKDGWWTVPDWNRRKRHPSLLDLLRLFWRHRQRFSQFMVRLEELAKPPQARFPRARALAHAA